MTQVSERPIPQPQQAFVLHISPSGGDRVPEALAEDQVIIGWAEAAELLTPDLDWEAFREIVRKYYYPIEPNLRKAGSAAGHMWRFIREMNPADLVVVPHGAEFYVAKVSGVATHDPSKIVEDSAFRRKVEWLNEKKPIQQSLARAALQSRMKTQGTCARATDLLGEIQDCLEVATHERPPSFNTDLHQRLVHETLGEIQSGRLDPFGFEALLKTVLEGLGAEEVQRRRGLQDKGADLLATFLSQGLFSS